MRADRHYETVNPGSSQGPATDATNQPVVDPTKNVLDLVGAMQKRQDDLREASDKRNDDLRILNASWRDRMDDVRSTHAQELRHAEADRINAIRAVDVGAVNRAAEVAAAQATALAGQVAASAEALRNQVAAAATAQTVALAAALEPIIKDIADLRRAQYEQQGQKTQVSESRQGQGNVGMWISLIVVAIFGLLGVMLSAIGILITISKP